MKTTIEINGKPVEIVLTKEQIEAIKKASEKITDRVKTFEDACSVLGVEPEDVLPVELPEVMCAAGHEKSIEAYCKLIIIAQALNEGWKPDWSNSNQAKYYSWFKQVGSGSGFAVRDCVFVRTRTGVGSRLCFKSSELAEYAGKQFESIYNDYLTL